MGRSFGRGARFILAAAVLALAASAAFAQAAPPIPSINGTISSISGNTLTLTLSDNSVKQVTLQSGTIILERDVAGVSDLKAGDAMGVAARRDGAALIATNINIFSKEMWDAVRKGQWLMSDGQTMTNALVTDYAEGMSGHTLTMKYKEGTASITVPDGVPVHRLVTVKQDALAAGMMVTVRYSGSSSGRTVTATSVFFDHPTQG